MSGMTPRDFFYWLQGHFELSALGTFIDRRQADLIVRHANLVDSPPERLLEIKVIAKALGRKPTLDVGVDVLAGWTADMRELVSAEFLHVIDPQDGDAAKQTELNKIHNPHLYKPGVTTPGGGIIARC